MSQDDVITAFDLLSDEIEEVIETLNEKGAQAVKRGEYETAKNLIRHCESLAEFWKKISHIQQEWLNNFTSQIVTALLQPDDNVSTETDSDEEVSSYIKRIYSTETSHELYQINIDDKNFCEATLVDLYREVLKFLYHNNCLNDTNVPHPTSSKRYLIAREPIHPSGRKFFDPIQYNGYHMETNKNRSTGLRQLVAFLNKCGLSAQIIK